MGNGATIELEAGSVIGGYELERRIGKGGMAEVWVARKARSRAGKFVAVKVILPHLAGQERYSRMFKREAELSSLLSHSNIVQVFDEGEDQGISYLVMEYVDGVNLVRIREAMAAMPDPKAREAVAAHLVGQLLHALSYAHSITTHEGEHLSIVHRDVSPQNVLVSNSGDVKLTDFGVAHTVIEESSGIHIKGKLRYMSPEQLGGKTKEPTIDLFACGAILHELLNGLKFRGEFEDDRVLYSQILSGAVPKLKNPCAPELDKVRLALLAGDPAQRVQTAGEALNMLQAYPGYRDMRLEVSKLCAAVTGVARPRTGPAHARPPSNPSATASRSIAAGPGSQSVAGPPTMGSGPHAAPGSGPQPVVPAGSGPQSVAGPGGAPPEPTAYLAGGGVPQGAAPSERTAYLQGWCGVPQAAGAVGADRVPRGGGVPGAPGVPTEPTAHLDSGGLPLAQNPEPTTYLAGGGLPQQAMPLAESGPQSVRDATNTENRPRPKTIPRRRDGRGRRDVDDALRPAAEANRLEDRGHRRRVVDRPGRGGGHRLSARGRRRRQAGKDGGSGRRRPESEGQGEGRRLGRGGEGRRAGGAPTRAS